MGSVTVDQKHVATEPKRGKTGKTKTEKCMVNERENSFQHRAVCSSCAPLPIYIGSQYEKFYIPLHTLKSSEHFSQDSIQCCEKPTGTHDFFPQFLLLYDFVINQHHHHILVEECAHSSLQICFSSLICRYSSVHWSLQIPPQYFNQVDFGIQRG